MATSKSSMPPWTCGGQVVGPDVVGTGGASGGGGLAGGEHGHPDVFARARRQRDGAPHHLVGLAGVDPEAHGQLDGLVEPAEARLFTRPTPRSGVNCWSRSKRLVASTYFFPFAMTAPSSFFVRPGEVVPERLGGRAGRRF